MVRNNITVVINKISKEGSIVLYIYIYLLVDWTKKARM